MTEVTATAESMETPVATNSVNSIEPEARRIRITIPPNQCVFIERQARDRNLEFNEVVYELIRDRIQQLTEPTPEPVEVISKEIKRLETHFVDHLVEIKALLHHSDQQTNDTPIRQSYPIDDNPEEDEGNLARLITAILQGHLQPPLHRLISQIETFQQEVRDADSTKCDRDQRRDQGELDRWFVAKAELEVLREMLSRVVLAATPPEHRAEFVEYTACIEEQFNQFESRLPPVPDYFLSPNDDD